eukprot:TRINITY_DN14968_c0_g1_i1.p2 TRINITY_DN14968_c0_g1~~TRINITY_DN14968_c0_g1_i1.p2  ORF type:complete len:288 (-),score=83.44 TRINITY_DN14968_c0_g1_i1:1296-2120(-)
MESEKCTKKFEHRENSDGNALYLHVSTADLHDAFYDGSRKIQLLEAREYRRKFMFEWLAALHIKMQNANVREKDIVVPIKAHDNTGAKQIYAFFDRTNRKENFATLMETRAAAIEKFGPREKLSADAMETIAPPTRCVYPRWPKVSELVAAEKKVKKTLAPLQPGFVGIPRPPKSAAQLAAELLQVEMQFPTDVKAPHALAAERQSLQRQEQQLKQILDEATMSKQALQQQKKSERDIEDKLSALRQERKELRQRMDRLGASNAILSRLQAASA